MGFAERGSSFMIDRDAAFVPSVRSASEPSGSTAFHSARSFSLAAARAASSTCRMAVPDASGDAPAPMAAARPCAACIAASTAACVFLAIDPGQMLAHGPRDGLRSTLFLDAAKGRDPSGVLIGTTLGKQVRPACRRPALQIADAEVAGGLEGRRLRTGDKTVYALIQCLAYRCRIGRRLRKPLARQTLPAGFRHGGDEILAGVPCSAADHRSRRDAGTEYAAAQASNGSGKTIVAVGGKFSRPGRPDACPQPCGKLPAGCCDAAGLADEV